MAQLGGDSVTCEIAAAREKGGKRRFLCSRQWQEHAAVNSSNQTLATTLHQRNRSACHAESIYPNAGHKFEMSADAVAWEDSQQNDTSDLFTKHELYDCSN